MAGTKMPSVDELINSILQSRETVAGEVEAIINSNSESAELLEQLLEDGLDGRGAQSQVF
jgi:hypothetical protein